ELEELKTLVSEKMVGAADLDVEMVVDMGEGNNWLEAH
ncbi:MAG: DNA polymerase I-like protein with 3'-5' exonuclease and polymerase domains, partial [Flavobacteriales bacterium]